METILDRDGMRKILGLACEFSCEAEVLLPNEIIKPLGYNPNKRQNETNDEQIKRILVEPTARVKLLSLNDNDEIEVEIKTSCFLVPGEKCIIPIANVMDIVIWHR